MRILTEKDMTKLETKDIIKDFVQDIEENDSIPAEKFNDENTAEVKITYDPIQSLFLFQIQDEDNPSSALRRIAIEDGLDPVLALSQYLKTINAYLKDSENNNVISSTDAQDRLVSNALSDVNDILGADMAKYIKDMFKQRDEMAAMPANDYTVLRNDTFKDMANEIIKTGSGIVCVKQYDWDKANLKSAKESEIIVNAYLTSTKPFKEFIKDFRKNKNLVK
jgi:hypothetical protein